MVPGPDTEPVESGPILIRVTNDVNNNVIRRLDAEGGWWGRVSDRVESIGDRILRLREAKGLSQSDLAKLVGVSQAAVSVWELNGRPVREVYLEPLARALGVSLSDLSPEHTAAPVPANSPREAALQEAVLRAVEDILTVAADANVVAPEKVAHRLSALGRRIWGHPTPTPVPADIMTQAEAAAALGVSRQAVHRLVAEDRVKAYANAARPDRAPLVSLREVRALVRRGHETEATEAAESGPPYSPSPTTGEESALNVLPIDDDTTPGVSPLSQEPTSPADEVASDPPWFADQYLLEELRTSSAAASGRHFSDRPKWERELLLREHREALREEWRRMGPEERAERLADWRRSHP